MKKHLTIDQAIQSVIFMTRADAKHILQKHFPRDVITIDVDYPKGVTEIHIGNQTRYITHLK